MRRGAGRRGGDRAGAGLSPVTARTQSRPLSAVFLEQVIQIEAVQRHRTQATDEYASGFFDAGRLLGELDDFRWSLDAPDLFSRRGVQILGVINARGSTPSKEKEISPGMRAGSDEAFAAWGAFVSELRNGDYIATATHPVTGERRDFDPTEWMRTGLVLEVHDGALFAKGRDGKLVELWAAITLRAAKRSQQKKARGHGYDWDGCWAYALTLRAEDAWDWTEHRRDKKQPLPAVRKVVEDRIKDWFRRTHRGRVPDISDIRQNIIIPLYAGRRTRGKRKR